MDLAAPASSAPQAQERAFRDRAAQEQTGKSAPDLAREAGRHHAPWMREYARSFRRRFHNTGRLLDIGIGYAWRENGCTGGGGAVRSKPIASFSPNGWSGF